jgi:hypothetical protein
MVAQMLELFKSSSCVTPCSKQGYLPPPWCQQNAKVHVTDEGQASAGRCWVLLLFSDVVGSCWLFLIDALLGVAGCC